MNQITQHNPAENFLQIINRLKQQHNNQLCPNAYKMALGLDESASDTDLIIAMGRMFHLIEEMKHFQDSSNRPDNGSLKHISSNLLHSLHYFSIGKPCIESKSAFDSHTVNYLHNIAESISYRTQEYKVLNEEQLSGFKDDLKRLFDEVEASSVDSDVKKYFKYAITEILHDLAKYEIGGSEVLLKTLQNRMGAFMLNPEANQAMNSEPSIFNKLGKVILAITVAVNIGNSYIENQLENFSKNLQHIEQIEKTIGDFDKKISTEVSDVIEHQD